MFEAVMKIHLANWDTISDRVWLSQAKSAFL